MSQKYSDFDFKNWDFLDPKIVSKFKTISEVSQMLAEQQDKLKNADFVSFKDKQKVQSNINRFKASLQNMIHGQKENLINYFDKQLDFVSKRVNVHHLSKTFQKSMMHLPHSTSTASLTTSRPYKKTRRFSEGDLSVYLKEKNMRDQLLSELKSTTTTLATEPNESHRDSHRETLSSSGMTMRSNYRPTSESAANDRGSWLNLDALETRNSYKPKNMETRKDSIFSLCRQDNDTNYESQILEKRLQELQEEVATKKDRIFSLRRFHNLHKRRIMDKKAKRRVKVAGKDFVRDSRMRRKRVEVRKVKDDNRESSLERENQELREQLKRANQRNEAVVKGMKELSQLVLSNEHMMEEMMENKRDIEKELKRSKELNSVLVGNFTEFKKYVQKTFGDVSDKLSAYVKKEEFYSHVAEENEQLKKRCKSLLAMLKEVTHN